MGTAGVTPLRTVMIGSGNVASALAPALARNGLVNVMQVFSKTRHNAEMLASQLGAEAITDPSEIVADGDLYIVALRDSAVESLIPSLPTNRALWLHTSGSLPDDMLKPLSERYGVIYPMQTFTKGVTVDWNKVAIFIHGDSPEIKLLAESLSPNVSEADHSRRRRLHAAAVFACNFTNYLWTMSSDILKTDGIDFSVMHPLIQETLRKAIEISPEKSQTGPAVRNDNNTMEEHIKLLTKEQGDLYRIISQYISDRYGSHKL